MVAADDYRGFQFAVAHHLVEGEAEFSGLSVNVMAARPGDLVMLDSGRSWRARLAALDPGIAAMPCIRPNPER